MTERTKQIRDYLIALDTITESEWEEIDKILSNKSDTTIQPKEEPEELCYDEKVRQVTELEKMIGVPAHIRGYYYLREAILLMMDNPQKYSSAITKQLYPDIARKFGATKDNVERGIRHAIKVAWNRGNPEIHNKILGSILHGKYGQPTNAEAISGFAEYVKMYML